MSYKSFDVLLIQRASINYYPPVINQASILAEAGLKVVIVDGVDSFEHVPILSSGVTLLRPLGEKKSNSLLDNIKFIAFVRSLLKACERNTVCIAYDEPAAMLLSILSFPGHKIFHFHEYPSGNGSDKLNAVLRNKLTKIFMSKSAQVVMADSHRSSAFFREWKLFQRPEVVRNCPRKITKLPDGELRNKLLSMGIAKKYIVVFQGSVSFNLYADYIVKSMRYWPCDSVMVFIGPIRSDMEKLLIQIAIEVGVSDRLVFFGQVPYSELFSYTADADVACTMIKPISFNYLHMAGASNKRYDAMACGVPQVCNYGPGMEELIVDNGIGVCVDADDPEEIGKAISNLLESTIKRKKMGENGRSVHLNKFNYEYQFKHILKEILKITQ